MTVDAGLFPSGVRGARVGLVPDADYLPRLRALVASARRRCLCSLFIVDLSPARDASLLVDGVLTEVAAAAWRGADARLVVGGSRTNFELAVLADLARARAGELGLPCRWLTSRNVRGSHMKMVVADDTVLMGSHNWSAGAFTDQTQDSLAVQSADLASWAANLFEDQWARAGK